MRSYFFTDREKVLLQSIINDSYESTSMTEKEKFNNDMLLSTLKARIRKYAGGLFADTDLMKKIIEKYDIVYSK